MKKLSKLQESIWGNINKRSEGNIERKEDEGLKLVIDGVTYYFADDFMSMGDVFNEENGDEWTAFAFNKMPNGSHRITGDTEMAGCFGCDKWDIGEYDYDVYVLKDYINLTKKELVQRAIDVYQIDQAEDFIKDILIKYIEDLFENHMSEYAYYYIYELKDSDMDDHMVISYLGDCNTYGEIDNIRDEFDKEIEESHLYLYPTIDNWYENLEQELTEAYEKEGWVKSEWFEPDFDSGGLPGQSAGMCFVKLEE
jgi:hypothetical protein